MSSLDSAEFHLRYTEQEFLNAVHKHGLPRSVSKNVRETYDAMVRAKARVVECEKRIEAVRREREGGGR